MPDLNLRKAANLIVFKKDLLMLLDYLQTVLLIARTAQESNTTQNCVLVYVICVNTNSNIVFKIL